MVNLVTILSGISLSSKEDHWSWKLDIKEIYSNTSTHYIILVVSQVGGDRVDDDVHILDKVWKSWTLLKVIFFSW